jgi:anti-sigma factor RsiW
MTACEREREAIGALVDGELAPDERAALEAHLAGCAGCRQEFEELSRLAAAFASLPAVEPAPDFEARFWARIAREADAPEGFAARLRRLLSPGRAIALGAVAAAALLLFLNLPRGPESRPSAAVAETEPAPAVARATAAAPIDTDVRILSSDRDFELLQDPEMDAISELDVLEDWDDAGPG